MMKSCRRWARAEQPNDAVQTIEATTLREEAGLLTVPVGSAALLIKRFAYTGGTPVEYAIDYYRGDRTKFRLRLGVLEQMPITANRSALSKHVEV